MECAAIQSPARGESFLTSVNGKEDPARWQAAEAEAARKRAAEEEAARKRAAEEEAARKRAAEGLRVCLRVRGVALCSACLWADGRHGCSYFLCVASSLPFSLRGVHLPFQRTPPPLGPSSCVFRRRNLFVHVGVCVFVRWGVGACTLCGCVCRRFGLVLLRLWCVDGCASPCGVRGCSFLLVCGGVGCVGVVLFVGVCWCVLVCVGVVLLLRGRQPVVRRRRRVS